MGHILEMYKFLTGRVDGIFYIGFSVNLSDRNKLVFRFGKGTFFLN